jgi:uncharacterized protein
VPSADFARSLEVNRPAEDCWGVLTDVSQVAGWVSVVGEVRELEYLSQYEVVLHDEFGPFKLNADLNVEVTDVDEGRSIRFLANGADRQVSTNISVNARLTLVPAATGTSIEVEGRWTVLGTVATMGAGTIRKKADTIVEEFFTSAAAALNA